MLTLLMWLYISVVDATVAVFDCTEFADGRSYLLIHQSVECAWIGNRDYESNGSSAWSHLVLSALPPLMAFVLGLPALFVVIFVRNMDNAQARPDTLSWRAILKSSFVIKKACAVRLENHRVHPCLPVPLSPGPPTMPWVVPTSSPLRDHISADGRDHNAEEIRLLVQVRPLLLPPPSLGPSFTGSRSMRVALIP